MADKEKHHGGPNGFLMGALVGGAIVYLVGTPKGRRILKEVSVNGMGFLEKIESIEDLANLSWDDLEEEEFAVSERPAPTRATASSASRPAYGRRFFKNVKKK